MRRSLPNMEITSGRNRAARLPKKVPRGCGRVGGRCLGTRPSRSAGVDGAGLRLGLYRIGRLRRKLQHGGGLALRQMRRQHHRAVREFDGVVMPAGLILVGLPEDIAVLKASVCPSVMPATPTTMSSANASSVPGRTQTAVVGSSGAANPRVPTPKFRVVSLSPT